MIRRLVITGVNGFVGRHLAAIAAEDGWSVHGVSTGRRPPKEIADHLDGYYDVDLRVEWPSAAPADSVVIHLAGLAAVGPSFDTPQDYLSGNSAMVTHMCEALTARGSAVRVVGVSTGAVYASSPGRVVQDEKSPVSFTSPYAVSKVLVENQLTYYRGRGLDTVVVRPFNHIGPGQGGGFLIPDLLAGLRALGPGTPLVAGNLDTRRDYTDVRDVARAYLAVGSADTLRSAVYNVASGVSRSGSEILAAICAATGSPVPPVVVDSKRLRPNDPVSITGDPGRIAAEVGWSPVIEFASTIADVVAHRD